MVDQDIVGEDQVGEVHVEDVAVDLQVIFQEEVDHQWINNNLAMDKGQRYAHFMRETDNANMEMDAGNSLCVWLWIYRHINIYTYTMSRFSHAMVATYQLRAHEHPISATGVMPSPFRILSGSREPGIKVSCDFSVFVDHYLKSNEMKFNDVVRFGILIQKRHEKKSRSQRKDQFKRLKWYRIRFYGQNKRILLLTTPIPALELFASSSIHPT